MLEKKYRVTSEKDYAKLFAKGRPFHGRGVGMKAMLSKLSVPRVGFVVSTKVAKKAVVRNQVKRRMREIVRKVIGRMQPGVDVVFMAKKESIDMTFAELERIMIELLAKSGIIAKQ